MVRVGWVRIVQSNVNKMRRGVTIDLGIRCMLRTGVPLNGMTEAEVEISIRQARKTIFQQRARRVAIAIPVPCLPWDDISGPGLGTR